MDEKDFKDNLDLLKADGVLGISTDVQARLTAMTKARVEEMLCIRSLRAKETELSDLLKCSEFNLEKSLKSLEAESRARHDAVRKACELEKFKENLENSLSTLQEQIQSYSSEQSRLDTKCHHLEDVVQALKDENADLKLRLVSSEKRLAEQSLEVYQCKHKAVQELQDPCATNMEASLHLERLQIEVKDISRSNLKLRRSNELMKLETWHSEELKRRNQALENTIIDLQAEIYRLTDLVKRAEEQNEKDCRALRNSLAKKTDKKKNWKLKAQEMIALTNAKSEEHQNTLSQCNIRHISEVEMLRETINRMSLDAAASQQNHENYTEQLINKISKLEKEIVSDTQSTISSVVNWKVDSLNKTKEAIRTVQVAADEEVKLLKRKLSDAEEEHERIKGCLHEAQRQINGEKNRCQEQKNKIQDMQKLLQLTSNDLQHASEVSNHYSTLNAQLRDQVKEARTLQVSSMSEVQRLENELSGLNHKVSDLSGQLALASENASKYVVTIKSLEEDVSIFRQEKIELESRLSFLEQETICNKRDIAQKEMDTDSISKKLEMELEKCSDLENEKIKFLGRIGDLEDSLRESNSKFDNIASQFITCQAHLVKSQDNVNMLQRQVNHLEESLQQCKSMNVQITDQKQELEKQMDLKSEELMSKENTLKKIVDDLEVTKSDLASEALQREEENRNVINWFEESLKSKEEAILLLQEDYSASLIREMKECAPCAQKMSSYSYLKNMHQSMQAWRRSWQEMGLSAPSHDHESGNSTLKKASLVIKNLFMFATLSTERCANSWPIFIEFADLGQKTDLSLLLKATLKIIKTRDLESCLSCTEASDNPDRHKYFLINVLDAVSTLVEGISSKSQEHELQLTQVQKSLDMHQQIQKEQAAAIVALNQKLGEARARNHVLQDELAVSANKLETVVSDNKKAREELRAAKNRVSSLEKNNEACEVEIRLSRLRASDLEHRAEQIKLLREREKSASKHAHVRATQKVGAILTMLCALKEQHSKVLTEVAQQMTCAFAVHALIADKLCAVVSSSAEYQLDLVALTESLKIGIPPDFVSEEKGALLDAGHQCARVTDA